MVDFHYERNVMAGVDLLSSDESCSGRWAMGIPIHFQYRGMGVSGGGSNLDEAIIKLCMKWCLTYF